MNKISEDQPTNPKFENIEDYFSYISSELGHPAIHHHFQSDVIQSDGIDIHLDVIEIGKKVPTIVFIPGTALYALCYSEFLYNLSKEGYNIVGFDPRGHGQSGGTRGDYTIEEIMTDTSNVISYAIKRFNKKVTVFGSSQGGIVAFYLSAVEERIQSVICQNIADLSSEDTFQLLKHPNMFKMLKPLFLRVGDIIPLTQVPVASYIDLSKIKVKYFGTVEKFLEIDPLALKTITVRALRSLASTHPPKPIEEFKTPILVLTGSEDHIFPLHYTIELYDSLTCEKKLEIYEHLDHAMLHEEVDIVLPPIIHWLKYVYEK